MQRLFKAVFFTCVLAASVAAQIDSTSVPVRWERYQVEDKNVSALFPKLPVLLADNAKSCYGEESAQYVAYADDSVYVLTVTYKVKPFEYCPGGSRKFSEKNFAERLKEIRNSEEEKKELNLAADDKATAKFVGKYWIRQLFNDPKNNRWFELYVASRDLTKPAVNNFLESMKIGQQTEGIKIGSGAPANYGDAPGAEQQTQAAKINPGDGGGSGSKYDTSGVGDGQNPDVISDPLILVFKPRANYTDAARQSDVQGTVRLRVTFLANGGIGSIAVVSPLSNGLTEQAMLAAKKIFFLPARRNNVKYSMTKIVEYSFKLY